MNALLSLENVVLEEVRQIRYGLSCKEQPFTGNYYVAPNHRIDDKSLHHVTFKKDSTGLSYLEMHLAVKGNKNAVILLSIRESPTNDDLQRDLSFGIYFSSNNISLQKTLVAVASANADGILSKTRFTPVYIKMNNGKLEIGKEGSSVPLLSFIDPDLRLVSHFSLGATDEATILYDCPTNIFQLIFNKP